MDDDLKTKEDWERAIAEAEADCKYAETMLKKYPKSAKYLKKADEAKSEAEEARGRLRELKSPGDQLRHKLERERKLGIKCAKLEDAIRQNMLIVAEAEDELD